MFTEIALITILTMAFGQGIFLFLGIPTLATRLVMELLIIVLFAMSFFTKMMRKDRFVVFGLLPLAGLFAVTCLSSYMNNDPILPFVLFCRHIFIFYFLFIALLNLEIPRKTIYEVNTYLIFLFLIQIPISFARFLIAGLGEGKGVGTMSVSGDTLSTIFPLFAITFCFAFYLFKKEKKYIIMIIGFFLFGIIGGKRALAFYLPVLFVTCVYFYLKRTNNKIVILRKSTIKVLFPMVILSAASLYGAAKMVPSLNPEEKIGGSFNIKHIVTIAIENYMWRAKGFGEGQIYAPASKQKLNTPGKLTLGRITTTQRSFEVLWKAGWSETLFGLGMNNLAESSLLIDKKSSEKLIEKFNIAYGITGFTWILLQVGFSGAGFLVYFYFKISRKAFKLYRCSSDKNYQAAALGFIGINFVFFLDFFTYSVSTLTLGVLTPVYFYIAFILFRGFIPENQDPENMSTEEVIPGKK